MSSTAPTTAPVKITAAWLQEATPKDLEALWKEQGAGFADTVLQQTRASLSTLKLSPKTFQPRDPTEEMPGKEAHIRTLAEAAKRDLLDPILVLPIAGIRVVLDGHCRVEAYREAFKKKSTKVPIRYFRGTFAEALLEAGALNSKDKLRLTTSEKAEQAWKLVLFDEGRSQYTVRDIAASSGISKSTVARMRKILREDFPAFDPRKSSWREVLEYLNRDRVIDDTWEAKLVHDWARRAIKTFGPKAGQQPDILLKALGLAYPDAIASWFEEDENDDF